MTTRTWIGGNAGDPDSWNEPLNWSGGVVPIDGDDVVIPVTTNEPDLIANTASLASLTINAGAQLTVGTFTVNAATVANSGTIAGTGNDSVYLSSGGIFTNSGTSSDVSGGDLGVRISDAPGTVTNEGTIAGGYAGVGVYGAAGDGLITNSGTLSYISGGHLGIRIDVAGTVTNEGTITGGYDGVFFDGGAGTVTNSGTITGTSNYGSGIYLHSGGSVTNTQSGHSTGGYGVQITGAAGTVTNDGTIIGTHYDGVFLGTSYNNTLIDSGKIVGGSTDAVQFGAGNDLLELLPGATFSGLVDGGTGTNTLELAAGTGAGSLTGLGTSFTNFGTLEFDSSAQWAVAGDTIGLGGAIIGFTTDDLIDLTGFAAVSKAFASNELVLTDITNAQVTLNIQGDFSTGDFHIVSDGSGGTNITVTAPCFCRGTLIRTDRGDVPVEALSIGDRVVTTSGAARPIRWIGHRHFDLARHPAPDRVRSIRILADAFADGAPRRDLWVSPDHGVLCDGVLVPARLLLNRASIKRDTESRAVTYYHVELDAHDILLAENLAAESYLDTGNRGMFENAGGPLLLHPDLTNDPARRDMESCRPFAADVARVEPIWRALALRAAHLGLRLPAEPETTDDPELCVLVDGRRLASVSVAQGRHVFVLPRADDVVRLMSRSTVPTETAPWVSDDRRLGVLVRRLIWRSGDLVLPIPLDHSTLAEGWWPPEWHSPTALCRWTNGDAVVPMPTTELMQAGPWLLEVEIGGNVPYPLPAANEQAELRHERIHGSSRRYA